MVSFPEIGKRRPKSLEKIKRVCKHQKYKYRVSTKKHITHPHQNDDSLRSSFNGSWRPSLGLRCPGSRNPKAGPPRNCWRSVSRTSGLVGGRAPWEGGNMFGVDVLGFFWDLSFFFLHVKTVMYFNSFGSWWSDSHSWLQNRTTMFYGRIRGKN